MRNQFVLSCILLLSACVGFQESNLPMEVIQQRERIEELVLRHGFTCAGHPSNEPVMLVRMMDNLFSREKLLKLRKCAVERSAHSYNLSKDGSVTFIFLRAKFPYLAHFARVTKEGYLNINESYADKDDPEFVKLPPN